MGERGSVKLLDGDIFVRLNPGLKAEVQILAALEGTSMASMMRILLREALQARRKGETNGSQASR